MIARIFITAVVEVVVSGLCINWPRIAYLRLLQSYGRKLVRA